jgi:phage/plasmid-associated DNA primase
MTSKQQMSLKPGEIRLDYIPLDWPLTPLSANKDPYVVGWQGKPYSVRDIEEEILTGRCKAIGLLGGPVYNNPYGLVWVDVDGPTVYQLIEEISGTTFDNALPNTLTIRSGKEGRERKLYKLDKEKHKHFVRNKYTWHAEGNKEKLEILWSKHQGVLMGLHPETDGYFTAEGQGFEWVQELPEFPEWLLSCIINKNVKQGIPAKETTRVVGQGFAINSVIGLERDIKLAREAMWGMPPEAADDYDIWIVVGQSLHSLDESLLDDWDEWSKQSEKYRDGECHRRWLSFSKGGGRSIGSLIHTAKENGWQPSEDYKAMNVDDDTLEHVSQMLTEIENDIKTTFVSSLAKPLIAPTEGKRTRTRTKKEGEEKEQKPRNPPSSEIADLLLGNYAGNLLYSQQHGQFFMYQKEAPGLWSPMTKVEVLGDIRMRLQSMGDFLPKGFTSNLMNDIFIQLQATLVFNDWYDGSNYLLFTNGVLEVDTRTLLPFSRDKYITQQMPYDYDQAATCEPIIKWLKHTQHGSWERAQVLRAWLRATLLGCYDIQKFIEIVGPGKSGKSTYANLAVALVGKQNTYSTDFENLEKNRFEAASYMGKKLLLFQDADRWGGSVSKLKAITGNDWIRSERKYQSEGQDPFQYHGMVMITANEAIQSTDYTSGLARRRLTVPFDRPFEGGQAEQKELIKFDPKGRPQGVFAPLLPGLVNWLLDMSTEEMRSYLMETSKRVNFFQKYEKMQSLRSNPLLDWMEHKLVFDPGASTPVGFCKSIAGGSNFYVNWNQWLYASYAEFCRSCNVGIMSRGRFEPLFLDICKHQLKLNVFAKKNSKGMRIFNVVVRDSNPKYDPYPSIVEVSADKEKYSEFYGMVLDEPTNEKMEADAEM